MITTLHALSEQSFNKFNPRFDPNPCYLIYAQTTAERPLRHLDGFEEVFLLKCDSLYEELCSFPSDMIGEEPSKDFQSMGCWFNKAQADAITSFVDSLLTCGTPVSLVVSGSDEASQQVAGFLEAYYGTFGRSPSSISDFDVYFVNHRVQRMLQPRFSKLI